MSNGISELCGKLSDKGCTYALIYSARNRFVVLCGEEDIRAADSCIRSEGFKPDDGKHKKELYLYGMKRIRHYRKEECELFVCFQLGCRSTLHGEWVPLDRLINVDALKRISKDKEGISRLLKEDELCFLLADCVYTRKEFTDTDRKRIEYCFEGCDQKSLDPKLAGVFFKYTPKLKELLKNREYDRIIPGLWGFADY